MFAVVALLLLLGRRPHSLREMDADPLPDDTRQQLIAAQAAIQELLDFECCEDSAGGAAYAQSGATDTCIDNRSRRVAGDE